jgi:protein O-mannosyl-transferase
VLLFDYSYNQVPVGDFRDPGVWAGLLLVGGILAAVILRRRKDAVLFWAAGFFAIAILPVSNLAVTIGSIMALRFLYLPSIGFAVAVTALVWRLRNERAAQALLTVLVVLCAARTLARNPAWADDGALAQADVREGTGSYRPYRLLGEFYYLKDPKNLDRAIAPIEKAADIIAPLPPAAGDQQIFSDLGLLYKLKGDQSGGVGTEAGRAWHEKSIAILLRGQTVLDAQAAAFDRAQQEHGRPLVAHAGNETLPLYLGRSYAALGRYVDAVQAFRKGRDMKPTDKVFFDELATAYAAQGKLEAAAIVIDQKAYAFGLSPATVSSIQNLYARIPDGACALDSDGGRTRLNLGCPRLRQHMCIGWADLARSYGRANLAGKALTVRNEAIRGAGCDAGLFAADAAVPML